MVQKVGWMRALGGCLSMTLTAWCGVGAGKWWVRLGSPLPAFNYSYEAFF